MRYPARPSVAVGGQTDRTRPTEETPVNADAPAIDVVDAEADLTDTVTTEEILEEESLVEEVSIDGMCGVY